MTWKDTDANTKIKILSNPFLFLSFFHCLFYNGATQKISDTLLSITDGRVSCLTNDKVYFYTEIKNIFFKLLVFNQLDSKAILHRLIIIEAVNIFYLNIDTYVCTSCNHITEVINPTVFTAHLGKLEG